MRNSLKGKNGRLHNILYRMNFGGHLEKKEELKDKIREKAKAKSILNSSKNYNTEDNKNMHSSILNNK